SVLLVPKIYLFLKPATKVSDDRSRKEISSFLKQYSDSIAEEDVTEEAGSTPSASPKVDSTRHSGQVQQFYFDPNKIGKADWIKLGLTAKQAESIEKYKA